MPGGSSVETLHREEGLSLGGELAQGATAAAGCEQSCPHALLGIAPGGFDLGTALEAIKPLKDLLSLLYRHSQPIIRGGGDHLFTDTRNRARRLDRRYRQTRV